jgi:hypothetical protein
MTEKKRTAWQASLSIAGETIGAAFHSAAGRRYLAASVARGAAAKAPGMEQWLVEWMLDDQREKTIPFSTSWMVGMASDCISSPQPRPVSARRQAIRKTRGRQG